MSELYEDVKDIFTTGINRYFDTEAAEAQGRASALEDALKLQKETQQYRDGMKQGTTNAGFQVPEWVKWGGIGLALVAGSAVLAKSL